MQNTPQRFEYEDDDFDPEAEYEFYDRDTESRLWESDSSYLVAVAPKNNRIRLKLIMGYRVQSVVHGLPNPEADTMGTSMLPAGRLQRKRLYDFYTNRDRLTRGMTPEEFNQLPEYQQRRILRERYLAKQLAQESQMQSASQFGGAGRRPNMPPPPSMSSFGYWAARNFDQIGWKSVVGIIAFIAGLFRTINSFR